MSLQSESEKKILGFIPELGKFWTIANVLSLVRIVLAVPISYYIITDGPVDLMLGLCLIAVLTDWFDGNVARWSNTVSEWGKVLDPIADKIGISMVIGALVYTEALPLWFIGLILFRDLIMILGGIALSYRVDNVAMSIWSGKIAISLIALTVLAALLRADIQIMNYCIWSSTALLAYSSFFYAVRFVQLYSLSGKIKNNTPE